MLDDADLQSVMRGIMKAAFFNTGQACTSASRLLVPSHLHQKITQRVSKMAQAMRVGPAISSPDIGPVISKEQLDKDTYYAELGVEEGGRLQCGGEPLKLSDFPDGFYFPPTVLSDVPWDARVAQEEIFGPVLSIIPYDTEEEAIKIANSTKYGLAASICSKNISRATDMAKRLKCGTVWINTHHEVPSYAPFGGYGMSGIGREHGLIGFREYQEIKHILTR